MVRVYSNWIPVTCLALGLLAMADTGFEPSRCWAQTIQLPTVRNFSVQTTVNVPDSGSALLGSSPSSTWGGVSRGGIPNNRGMGGSMSVPTASVHVCIIDLNALDEAILSAARNDRLSLQPPEPQSNAGVAAVDPGQSRSSNNTMPGIATGPMGQRRTYPSPRNAKRTDYAYMALLNHPDNEELQHELLGDVSHYLELANHARSGGHWASAQLFYEQAWRRLPVERQQAALRQLKQHQAAADPESSTKPNRATR